MPMRSQRARLQPRQRIGHEQRKGKDQQPEAGAGRDAGKGVALGRQVARGAADQDDQHAEHQEAPTTQLDRGRAQQRDADAGRR